MIFVMYFAAILACEGIFSFLDFQKGTKRDQMMKNALDH